MATCALTIAAIPCLRDNYAWLITRQNPALRPAAAAGDVLANAPPLAVVVDPGEAGPVIEALTARGLRAAAVLATHHHRDHVGGIEGVLAHPAGAGAKVIGSAFDVAAGRIPKADQGIADGETCTLLGETFVGLATPGHTKGAICYHLPAHEALFTGDTLFLAGCGRLLEGSAAELWASLQRLMQLPAATRIYCGHEYTRKNLAFAAAVLPHELAIPAAQAAADEAHAQRRPSVPGRLDQQLRVNPFLRAAEPVLLAKFGVERSLACFSALRAERDAF